MTRKDYVLIAAALHDAGDDSEPHSRDFIAGIEAAAYKLADALSRDNARFDRERFLKACGVVQS